MRHPNRYPRPKNPPTPLRRDLQLDVEIEALKKQRDTLLAAIEFALETADGIGWLAAWSEGNPFAMAQLDTWIADRGTP